jgi:NAD(P)-dependent dehydrogenase (short-subunit alcohol dehydrogenase family)
MLRTPERDKHIVNVSAVEGQFYRKFKTTRHPHTNMAKAALNMMTRTAAADYWNDGIHMNSVDTGWVTDEDPAEIAERTVLEHRFHPPLDIVDGAARIVDPSSAASHRRGLWGPILRFGNRSGDAAIAPRALGRKAAGILQGTGGRARNLLKLSAWQHRRHGEAAIAAARVTVDSTVERRRQDPRGATMAFAGHDATVTARSSGATRTLTHCEGREHP